MINASKLKHFDKKLEKVNKKLWRRPSCSSLPFPYCPLESHAKLPSYKTIDEKPWTGELLVILDEKDFSRKDITLHMRVCNYPLKLTLAG